MKKLFGSKKAKKANAKANETPKAEEEKVEATTKEQEPTPKMTKIAIVYYSTYGHVRILADEILEGLKSAGVEGTLLQIPETLPKEVLEKMGAPARDDSVPDATADALAGFDGILFGIPTRLGMCAAQVKAFMDTTGGLWMTQALSRKTAGIFFSTGTQNGGQETTALTFITQLTHQGMIFVPLGYTHPGTLNMDEIKGGSPYGPGTMAGATGARMPSDLEKEIAKAYAVRFAGITDALVKGGVN